MSVHWHIWAQLCHNEADTPDSLHLYEIGPNEAEGQYYSSLSSDRISAFQLCSKFRPQMGWGLRGGLPIHRAGIVYVSCEGWGVISGPVASCHGGTNLVPREGNVIGAGRMESDAENAQVDAVAKIIFWPYCSAAME